MEATVPSRIVLMGTSKISLNERFSHIPVAPKMVTRRSIASLGNSYSNGTTATATAAEQQVYREPIVSRRPLYVDDFEDDDFDPVDDGSIEATTDYVEPIRIVPRRKPTVYQNLPPRFARIPIRNRISFPLWRNRFSNVFVRKNNIIDRPRPFGSLRYASRNTHFVRNGFISRTGNSNAFWRSRSRTFRGRGSAGGGTTRANRPTITREELDQELDEYMKKGKHPQIDVSDLK